MNNNKKKSKGIIVKIIAIFAVVGVVLLALTPLLAILGNI